MSNRSIELWIMAVTDLLLLAAVLGAVFWPLFRGHAWQLRDTKRFIVMYAVLGAMGIGVQGVAHWHYWNRTSEFAEIVGKVPVRYREWIIEDDEYKPGVLWFGGAVAPGGFEHGTAWWVNFETEGYEINTFALENPKVVYVDVYGDGWLDGVYEAEFKEGCFPSITKPSKPRKPTETERQDYASLTKK